MNPTRLKKAICLVGELNMKIIKQHREVNCPKYDRCLETATVAGSTDKSWQRTKEWKSFSCKECDER